MILNNVGRQEVEKPTIIKQEGSWLPAPSSKVCLLFSAAALLGAGAYFYYKKWKNPISEKPLALESSFEKISSSPVALLKESQNTARRVRLYDAISSLQEKIIDAAENYEASLKKTNYKNILDGFLNEFPQIKTVYPEIESVDSLNDARGIFKKIQDEKAIHSEVQARMISLWRAVCSKLSESNYRFLIDQALKEIGDIDSGIQNCYIEQIKTVSNFKDAQSLVRLFLEDRRYLNHKMVVHSDAGDRGTLIVNYPLEERQKDYVIKWVDDAEIDATRIYDHFSKAASYSFSVPKFAAIFWKDKTYVPFSGKEDFIALDLCNKLKSNYELLLKSERKGGQTLEVYSETLNHPSLMLSEKVQGEGLFDFINSKYSALTHENKRTVFSKIGSLVSTDFLLHQTDRINIVAQDEQGVYHLALAKEGMHSEATNLNNLMVDSAGASPCIYAIDNCLEGDLNSRASEKYTEFLKKFFLRKDWKEAFSQAVIEAVESAVGEERNEDETLFLNDLNDFGKSEIEKSIQTTIPKIRQGISDFELANINLIRLKSKESVSLVQAISRRKEIF